MGRKLSFWKVATVNGRSEWVWVSMPFLGNASGRAAQTACLASGKSFGKSDPRRGWNKWHGSKDKGQSDLQIIWEGIFQVQVGNKVRSFGPGQPDGLIVCFDNVLVGRIDQKVETPNGHRTRVLKTVRSIRIHLRSGLAD